MFITGPTPSGVISSDDIGGRDVYLIDGVDGVGLDGASCNLFYVIFFCKSQWIGFNFYFLYGPLCKLYAH